MAKKRKVPQSIIKFAEKTDLDYLPEMYASGEVQDESNEYSLEFLNDDDITKPYFVVSEWESGANCGFATEKEVIECVQAALAESNPSDMYHVDVYKFPEGYKMGFNISLVKEDD